MKKLLTWMSLGVVLLSEPTWARSPVEPRHLHIVLDRKSTQVGELLEKTQSTSIWKETCKTMGKSLLVGEAPYGFGVFQSYSCYLNNTLVFGKQSTGQWELRVSEQNQLKLALWHTLPQVQPMNTADSTSKNQPEISVELPLSSYNFELLANKDFVDLVSLLILDGLPIMGMVPGKVLRAETPVLSSPPPRSRKWPLPSPPSKLTIFELEHEPLTDTWVPLVIGSGVTVNGEERQSFAKQLEQEQERRNEPKEKQPPAPSEAHEKSDIQSLKPKPAPSKEVPVSWLLDIPQPRRFQSAWIHASEGRGTMYFELAELVQQAAREFVQERTEQSKLLNAVTATLNSGLVGVRYGLGILPSKEAYLVGEFTNFALVSEIRGGPLAGLRFYYDLSPEVRDTYQDQQVKYRSSRFVLGWSFGVDVDWLVINRLDLVPKIGQWTFDARLPRTSKIRDPATGEIRNGETSIFDFKLDTALSTGYEIGVEKLILFTLIRGWIAQDRAFAFLSAAKGDGTVTSLRLGLDGYIEGPELTTLFDWMFLGFYMYERIEIVREQSETTPIAGFDYYQIFLGGGVSVSW